MTEVSATFVGDIRNNFMKERTITCPKCNNGNVKEKTSWGGFSVYSHLECTDCGFAGGRVVVYDGEESRVDKQIRERFTLNNKQDDVRAFISSIV